MKPFAVFVFAFISAFMMGQENDNSSVVTEKITFLSANYDETLIPFDTEKRVFYKESTVYTEDEFERIYQPNQRKLLEGDSKAAQLGAEVVARGTIFFLGKVFEGLLMPKPKTYHKKKKRKSKGIRN